MNKEELAKEHAKKVWGVYVDDVHPDVHITQTNGEISESDFIAGFEAKENINEQLLDDMLDFLNFIHDKIRIPNTLMETYSNMHCNLLNQINEQKP
jgi:hypothetical protein